jgi:hypothetical protein
MSAPWLVRHLLIAVGFAVSLCVTDVVHAQRAAAGPPADILAAQQLLYAVYPELARQVLTISVVPDGPGHQVRVAEAVNPLVRLASAPFLSARVELTAGQQLVSFVAEGPYVKTPETHILQRLLADHPDWGVAEAQVWLHAQTGRVASPDLAVASDPARLRRFLTSAPRAAVLQTPSLTVGDRNPIGDGRHTVLPAWRVALEAPQVAGAAASYVLQFEPITGRLISAVRQ